MRVRGLLLLLYLAFACAGEESEERETRPGPSSGAGPVVELRDRTVVLTFDDTSRSHLEFVAPLLLEHGFSATFFVTAKWMDDPLSTLTWREIAKLDDLGFEIGSHTWGHYGLNSREAPEFLPRDLGRLEAALEEVGIPKPVSLAWPGGAFGPEAIEILRRRGYRLARRGLQPERPLGVHIGVAYDPGAHDPLLIPTTGEVRKAWTLEHLREVVGLARDGKAAVLTFHGVPDTVNADLSTPPEMFRTYMAYLKENGVRVIAMRDLIPVIEGRPRPDDPRIRERCPEGD